jgi:hypothetical protein
MVLTASFALSPVIGLVCHRRLADMVLSAPGRADMPPLNLTPASRRQDHTTSPSASQASLVSAPLIAHKSKGPALRLRRAPNAAASTTSRPASVTIAIRPSVGRDGEASKSDLGHAGTGIFLQIGLDRANQIDPLQQIAPSCSSILADSFEGRVAHLSFGGLRPVFDLGQ